MKEFEIFISQLWLIKTQIQCSTHSALSNFFEDLCARIFGDVVSDFQVTECACTLGMDDSLRDSLAVEVRQFIDEVDVLQKNGSANTGGEGGGLDANGGSTREGYNARCALKMRKYPRELLSSIEILQLISRMNFTATLVECFAWFTNR